ncbi:bifunctional glycosyltransferase/CDP-glycerol:glycerophosphate glycerophosphotransferase [Nocardiopsis algeriensis]|uniref:bifunctional glycosyltransferase/CDP-glycerol:glycerophosphate glycerophosphotransferase n=1 Tax=Nocardiopsis algeriensis TaxID=1478215 RepID=UPI003B435B62
MSPKLSVVVPFYNVEEFFEECLASVAKQTLQDIEVLMVDDGSPDDSVDIARNWEKKDARFRLIRQENQGLGPARNTGAGQARGEYLTFLDSDDVLPVNAYELLVSSLERTGSDFASGNVRRFNSRGDFPSGIHKDIFQLTREKTHVSKEPVLLQDRIACNKVFRTSFWRERQLEFPGGRYEDTPVIVPAHAYARSVDILRQTVYLYRVRENGNNSITQQRTDIGNMRDRVRSVNTASRRLAEGGYHDLKRAYDLSVLRDDFLIFMRVLPQASDEYRKDFSQRIAAFAEGMDEAAFEELSALNRLRYWLLREGRVAELLEVLDAGESLPEAVQRDGKWYGTYPFFEDPEAGVPSSVYELDKELQLRTQVDDIEWRADRLHITGYAGIKHIGAPTQEANRITLKLRHTRLGLTKSLRVRQFASPAVTTQFNQPKSFDWAAFEATVDLGRLKMAGFLLRGTWEVTVQVDGQGVVRTGTLGNAARGRPKLPSAYFVGDGARVVPVFDSSGRLLIRVEKKYALLRSHSFQNGSWYVECELPRGGKIDDPVLVLSRSTGSLRRTYPMELRSDADGRHYLVGQVPADALVSFPDAESDVDDDKRWHQELDWHVQVGSKGVPSSQVNLVIPAADFAEQRELVGHSELCATKSRQGNVLLVDRLPRMVVRQYRWTDSGSLHVTGDYAGPAHSRPGSVQLRKRLSHVVHNFPVTWVGNGFSLELTPGRMEIWGEERGLPRGNWDLVVRTDEGNEVPVMLDRTLVGGDHDICEHGRQTFTVQPRRLYEMALNVRAGYKTDERGTYAQKVLRDEHYPAQRSEPLRDMVLFESYFGTQYSCNPKAVYEELVARGTDLELVWATEDGSLRVPGPARTVLIGSKEHMEVLARARYIVSNCGIQYWYVKREGQTYIQTWHGSPLKRVGLDVDSPTFNRAAERLRRLAADAQKWDVLVSQSAFTTPIMRRAMAYQGKVAEIGYPRNDVLHSQDADERGQQVRKQLGIDPGKRVVLYAPTWRDDGNKGAGTYQFDLQLDVDAMRERLGKDHVLLLRLHHLINRHQVIEGDEFVKDVSNYPDVNDLCMASDVLITDYSSIMFDYAGTGKTLLLYTYDYEKYRNETRGLSFDLAEHAPGPLLRNTDEVIGVLEDLDTFQAETKEQYREFRELFCPYEDGGASARVVELMEAGRA